MFPVNVFNFDENFIQLLCTGMWYVKLITGKTTFPSRKKS